MDEKILGLGFCALLAAAIVARFFWLLANRTPVLAHAENMDALGETLPGDPLNPPQRPQGRWAHVASAHRRHARRI